MIKPVPLRNLSKSLADEKLELANDILADLNKAKRLGNPTPEKLAENTFLHNLKYMKAMKYTNPIFIHTVL